MGYFKEGKWVAAQSSSGTHGFDRVAANKAVKAAVVQVKDGQATARDSVQRLFTEFPVLKKDDRRTKKGGSMSELIRLFWHEHLSDTTPVPAMPREETDWTGWESGS